MTAAAVVTQLVPIGAIAAIVRRRNPIGGWLFFALWQIFTGCAGTLLQIAIGWHSYVPSAWANQTHYLVYVMTTAPRLFALIAATAVSILLLRTFEWRWAVFLRGTLAAFLVCGALTLLLDLLFSRDELSLAAASLITPAILFFYSLCSVRYRKVFQTHDWNPEA